MNCYANYKKAGVIALTLAIPISIAATGYNRAQAWVLGEPVPISLLSNVSRHIPHSRKGLSLVLMKKEELLIMPNGNKYLRVFLINSADSVATISRSDATLVGVSSEVFANGKWRLFQTDSRSICGNSYWS